MSIFDKSADEYITDSIEDMTRELRHARTGSQEYWDLIKGIAQLRESMSPKIIQEKKNA